ncbi:hypothetical protein BH11ACT6_BH11ACT6_34750 [soil metagenome]
MRSECVGCAMGAHPHDTYAAKAPEVKSGAAKVGDDAGCPNADCKCTYRRPRADAVSDMGYVRCLCLWLSEYPDERIIGNPNCPAHPGDDRDE